MLLNLTREDDVPLTTTVNFRIVSSGRSGIVPSWAKCVKCEHVLNLSYAPNPSDPNEIALFELQQRFMYSVFAKTLVEGKAANILPEYLDPQDKTKFGDAQKSYTNLCDFCEGGAMT